MCGVTAAFMGGHGERAGGIAYAEEVAPTIKAAASGSNSVPTICASYKSFGEYAIPDTAKSLLQSDDITTGDLICAGVDCRNGRENGDLCGTPNTVDEPAVYDGRGNGTGETAPTITGDHNRRISDYTSVARIGKTVRRLTPTECERLQGYPDGWTEYGAKEYGRKLRDKYPDDFTKGMTRTGMDAERLLERISDAARYKALGNSLALPCVNYVIGGIVEVLL